MLRISCQTKASRKSKFVTSTMLLEKIYIYTEVLQYLSIPKLDYNPTQGLKSASHNFPHLPKSCLQVPSHAPQHTFLSTLVGPTITLPHLAGWPPFEKKIHISYGKEREMGLT